MKLVGVAMIRNEADIVEAFVRHNLRHVDHLVLVDHNSSDATGEILLRLRGEGLPLTLGTDRSVEFNQGRVLSAAMRTALAAHDADYGFALDADEFIIADSRAVLESELAGIPADGVGYLRWVLYVPPREACEHVHPFERVRRRVVDERVTMRKVVVPRRFAAMPDRYIDSGNHWVFDVAAGAGQSVVPGVELRSRLAHLPFRSVAQTTQKALRAPARIRCRQRDRAHQLALAARLRAGCRTPARGVRPRAARRAVLPRRAPVRARVRHDAARERRRSPADP